MPNRASAAWRKPSSASRRPRRRPRSRGGGGAGGAGHGEHQPGTARASRALRAPHAAQQSQGVASVVAAWAQERRPKRHEFEAKPHRRTVDDARRLPTATPQLGKRLEVRGKTQRRSLGRSAGGGAAEVDTHTLHRARRATSPHGRCRRRSRQKNTCVGCATVPAEALPSRISSGDAERRPGALRGEKVAESRLSSGKVRWRARRASGALPEARTTR